MTIFQYYTPDVLRTFGVGCPNGSLWTIPIEFIFYLLLPILFFFKKRNIILFLCFVLSIFINICLYNSDSSGLIYKLLSVSVFPWLYIFLFGSLIYLNWTKLRFLFEGKAFYYFVSYLLYVSLISEPSYYITSIEVLGSNLLLGCLTISLAFTKVSIGKSLRGFDLSYGLYVYHMIVVNIFVQMGLLYEIKYAITVLVISMILGAISWFFIEKRVLSLKNKLLWH